ncbi:MAG: aminopeptidase N [Planctomycetota bacterium]|nr:aminopeptidase N [Planctomycetota bacterium]
MTTQTTPAPPQPIFRKDYVQPDYWIDEVELRFELGEGRTLVHAKLTMRANDAVDGGAKPIELMGEELETLRVALDGRELGEDEYSFGEEALTLPAGGASCVVETTVAICPEENLTLSGLYKTSGNFCTQCEAEGFRRITWYLDRPDVMASFKVVIDGDPELYPVMLSNGNKVGHEELENGHTRVTWVDPHKKPAYLFALVAGKLECHAGTFTTMSGREVKLEIWVEPQNIEKCEHALVSLQKSMKWDEEVFGLEYDLDIYMVVAVDDFNMGAMENKGLNVFNSQYVLASPATATDGDYEGIEGVIAHEYFHNWTGNRVTCRDWFQLTLKEGLTVFRDQQFSADMLSHAVQRIGDAQRLRLAQFAEDAGPMAHPIRPESYIEMNNFYTSTVYEKGAEVIRMYHTLLGAEGFRKGMDLYFERHDGQAVTCDDFRAAMADASGKDLDQFERWYTQAGTPTLTVTEAFDAAKSEYTLTFEQSRTDVPSGNPFEPMHLPVRLGLLGADGKDLALHGEVPEQGATEAVIELRAERTCVTFTGITARPVPSLLRNFSAPVKLVMDESKADLAFRMANDSDAFNRYEAGQRLMKQVLLALVADASAGKDLAMDAELSAAYAALVANTELDPSLKAMAMGVPAERALAQEVEVVDPDAIHAARSFVRRELAAANRDTLFELYRANEVTGAYRYHKDDIGRRSLRNSCLGLLSTLIGAEGIGSGEELGTLVDHFKEADNMTDEITALAMLASCDVPERAEAMAAFHQKWKHEPLVINKWFTVQSTSSHPQVVDQVLDLFGHPDFTMKNPNRARSLVGAFAMGNHVGFHRADGAGYRFLAERVIEIHELNPQVAARLVGSFNAWRRYDQDRQTMMQGQLQRILAVDGLSKNVFEIVSKALV